jgi:putative CocE/NonD family hydrolase
MNFCTLGSLIKHLVFLILCFAALPCIAQRKADYNLDFEELNKNTGLPKKWGLGNIVNSAIPSDSTVDAYKTDSLINEHGKYSLLIDWTNGYKKWTASNYVIRQVFKGDKIKLTGYIKTENVTEMAGLWMRLDGENKKNYGFDNMHDRPITGTTDWKEYSIELDYDEDNVKSIVVGGLIEGKGKMWMDNLHITIDGVDILEAQINMDADKSPSVATDKSKYIIDDSVMITMRDGAQISASTARKRSITAPQPIVLMFDIYPSANNKSMTKYCAEHGYIGIIADTRGKRLGKEEIEPFEHDATDAYDIIDWISKQPWCNGKIGMYGGSYLGFSQWAAVKKVHPALKTIVPQVAVGPGIDFPTHFGINSCYALRWLHYVTNNRLTDYDDFEDVKKWANIAARWYASGKAFNTLDTLEGHPNKIFQRWMQHPFYDSYWNNMVPYQKEFAQINIPILTISGYYDDDQRGAMYYFDQHHLYNKGSNDYLVIGPYDHSGAQRHPGKIVRGYAIDSIASINIQELVFQWFDYVLKDSAKPLLLKDKINFEVMGANKWRHVSSLSAMNNDTLTFYLDNTLTDKGYKLRSKPGSDDDGIKQQIDFTDRSDSTDRAGSNRLKSELTGNNETSRYLKFVSDPLNRPVSINGSFIANLVTVINKKDMDIIIDLYEQKPDGRYMMLSENLVRCSLVKDCTKRQLLLPGKLETIVVDNTFFTSRLLSKGSRIVLLIGVNKNSTYEVNYGTGKDVSTETIKDGAEPLMIQWITKNSYIKLPVFKE